jgi:hypothetical protein
MKLSDVFSRPRVKAVQAGSPACGGVLARVLPGMGLGGQHLADLPNAGLAIGARLAAFLDLPESARSAADLFGDAAIGDAFADADEHWTAGPS